VGGGGEGMTKGWKGQQQCQQQALETCQCASRACTCMKGCKGSLGPARGSIDASLEGEDHAVAEGVAALLRASIEVAAVCVCVWWGGRGGGGEQG
jgi:hypothetical protein